MIPVEVKFTERTPELMASFSFCQFASSILKLPNEMQRYMDSRLLFDAKIQLTLG